MHYLPLSESLILPASRKKTCQIGSIWSNGILWALYGPICHTTHHNLLIIDNLHWPVPTHLTPLFCPHNPRSMSELLKHLRLERSCIPEPLLSLKSTSFHFNSQKKTMPSSREMWYNATWQDMRRTVCKHDFRTWEGEETEPKSPSYENCHSSA